MSAVIGNKLKVTIFGESHGEGLGVVIDGLPVGIQLDFDYIRNEMKRRAPGKNSLSTSRKEGDEINILSGVFNDTTTGAPLCGVIYNTNQHSKDYSRLKALMRPGHADYTGFIKYNGFNDYRGGGHFSGRLTAGIVFAGAIAKQILEKRNIIIGSHIKSIENIDEGSFDFVNIDEETLKNLRKMEFPVLDEKIGDEMIGAILTAKEEKDSTGGIIEAAIVNVPAGIGEPFFDSLESRLAHILFSVPGVKGVEFGVGFGISKMRGSISNDAYSIIDGEVRTTTNNNGGILGGITNGMPIIFRTAIKPTSSIGRVQKTINIEKMEEAELVVEGRHDPCIVQRAVPVIESAAAITILDLILERDVEMWRA